jgi:cysteinyl-tRNA synthetase
MAHELLGAHFDIHGGGNDLMFPHHENEIAQSCCAHPGSGFANVWMHNEMLQVEGKKMSKSLGNFFTVRDLLEQGVPGEVIRFVMLSTHYRKPMDWTEKKAVEAEKTLRKWRQQTDGVDLILSKEVASEALSEDLNTSEVIMRMHSLSEQDDLVALKATGAILGLLHTDTEDWSWRRSVQTEGAVQFVGFGDETYGKIAREIASRWLDLRTEKNFVAADELRSKAAAAGLELRAMAGAVQAEQTSEFDPAKLEALK